MICKLKNLRIFCKRLKIRWYEKCRKARKIENPHVLNTVFNTWGNFLEKWDRCLEFVGDFSYIGSLQFVFGCIDIVQFSMLLAGN